MIRLRGELSGSIQGVFKEYSPNLGTIFLELLNRFWIPVSFPCVNIQLKKAFYANWLQLFSNFRDIMLISNNYNSKTDDGETADLAYQMKLLKK